MDDERLRAFVREEFDRRAAEKQRLCMHPEGTILPGKNLEVRCNLCDKIMDEHDLENAYGGLEPSLSPIEQRHVGRAG